MEYFAQFFLDREKDIIVDLYRDGDDMKYVLRTPNHKTGNLISNLAKMCSLPISYDTNGLKIIEGIVPCYIDGYGREVYIFRLNGTKVANIFPSGIVEMKASIPAISKTLMSQTKDYQLDFSKTVVKTYIRKEYKFSTDLHTHMNANLTPDNLIALGIVHQIQYPLYYIRKLNLKLNVGQQKKLSQKRSLVAEQFYHSSLTGKYLTRKIDDNTFINFADLILNNPNDMAYNISKIRTSLAVLKDGQAVFTNLEKVYLYRYVFTKGKESQDKIDFINIWYLPDEDLRNSVMRMMNDKKNPNYKNNTLFQDKLLWIARQYQQNGIEYAEISDTTLVKETEAAKMLAQVHEVMPHIYEETHVMIRFLAGIRRVPLTIVKDHIHAGDYLNGNIRVLKAIACDPYVAGSDIIGEEINDIRNMRPLINELVQIAEKDPYFTIRIHAGENDSLKNNVENSILCVMKSLKEGERIPDIRIGHGLYTANLKSAKGKALIELIRSSGAVLEFQITSNVRLNNLSTLEHHPLKQYLSAGLPCVQGTDGGALYGTNSIDEELALEKMLDLTPEDMMHMHDSEKKVLEKGMEAYYKKSTKLSKRIKNTSIEEWFQKRIDKQPVIREVLLNGDDRLSSIQVLSALVAPLPEDKIPVIICGGSFNNDTHATKMRKDEKKMLDLLMENGKPENMFFVIGNTLTGYEKYVVDHNNGKYHIHAIVPALIKEEEQERIMKNRISVTVSTEAAEMGLYKSFAYEIFKRRYSVLIALDGNSAGVNMIQESRNGKKKCRTFVSEHSRMLKDKASSLHGYITFITNPEDTSKEIISRVKAAWHREMIEKES